MRNLLSANFLRLKKSRLFWASLAFMAGYSLWLIYKWTQFRMNSVDIMLFDYCVVTSIVAAAFSSLFLGAEYSDGAIRNKLVIGHSRSAIYFSNLLTNIAAAFLQCAVYLTVTLGLGLPLLGPSGSDPGRLLLLFAGTLGTVVAFCAIFTAIGMLCSQKAGAAVICIAGAFVLFGMMSSVDSYLNVPKYSTHIEVHADGHADVSYQLNEGSYVSGTRRAVFEFLDDVVPSGQAVQYMRNRKRDVDPVEVRGLSAEQVEEYMQYQRPPVDPLPLLAYSLAVTAAATSAGLFLFRRKDLK